MLQTSLNVNSSLLSKIDYDEPSSSMTVHFKKYYVDSLTYEGVGIKTFAEFASASSPGRYYLNFIKNKFKLKTIVMADIVIKCRIDVTKINKDYLFVGEKGVYLDLTVLYNHEKDKFDCNGMIVQDVPSKIYKEDKTKKGSILGNCRVFGQQPVPQEALPGTESGEPGLKDGIADDLPF